MKKILIAFTITFALSNCEIKVKQSNATTSYWSEGYISQKETYDNMTYLVFYKTHESSQTGYAIYAINLTKDSVETEYYRQMLNKLKKE